MARVRYTPTQGKRGCRQGCGKVATHRRSHRKYVRYARAFKTPPVSSRSYMATAEKEKEATRQECAKIAPRYSRDTAEIHTSKGVDAGKTAAHGGGDAPPPSAASYQLFLHDGSKTLTINGMHGSDDVGVSATHAVHRSQCVRCTQCVLYLDCTSVASLLHLGCLSAGERAAAGG